MASDSCQRQRKCSDLKWQLLTLCLLHSLSHPHQWKLMTTPGLHLCLMQRVPEALTGCGRQRRRATSVSKAIQGKDMP